jgi:phage/plasmid-like protein (TIGR03299 family)
MPHNLEERNGQASMFYTGDVPWHQLGRRLDRPATAEEAMNEAKLDYTVIKRPMKAIIHGRHYADVPMAFATIRTDTNVVLGVVGSRYEPVQNIDCFSFFDPLIEHDEAVYHTAGVLGKGEKIWLLAKLPDYIRIGKKGDPIEKFVLLYNSHDGSSKIRVKLTPIRVVCNNTLTAALSGSDQEVQIKHTAAAVEKLQEAHKVLELTNQLYRELDYIFNRMAIRKVSSQQLVDYIKTLVPDNEQAESKTRTENTRNHILSLHDDTKEAAMHKGTLFGAFNAVTELVDHYSNQNNASKQLKSMWFGGSGEQLKVRAYKLAESML